MVNVPSTAATDVDRNPRPASLGPAAPPQGAIEHHLVELWQDALKIEPIGVTDDYFDLGGDSFAAVEMFLALEDEFGTTIPVSDVLQYPTIRALAAYILDLADEGDGGDSRMITLGEEGDKKPLIFIHGLGGEVFIARMLKKCLDTDRPLFAIRVSGDDAWVDEAERIEDIAAEYAKIIRSKQTSGPYYLSGMCLGGSLALEIARILKGAGEEVGQVILMDTLRHEAISWRRRIPYLLGPVLRLPPKEAWRYFSKRARWWFAERLSLPLPQGRGLYIDGNMSRWQARFMMAHRRYRPEPYDGPITVFASEEHIRLCGSTSLGWERVAHGEFKAIRTGQAHSDMWSSHHFEAVGEHIRKIMAGQP